MSKILKICGMTKIEQIKAVIEEIEPELIGFIFYPHSPRYLGNDFNMPEFINSKTKKTGVFVNESHEKIQEIANIYSLDYIQLHGDENPEFVMELCNKGLKAIKAFRVDKDFDIKSIASFEVLCDFFLFDAHVKGYGGGGVQFDWSILEDYEGHTPWLLSGGLNLENMKEVSNYQLNNFAGFDVNSGFEKSPGDKDINMLKNIYKRNLLK